MTSRRRWLPLALLLVLAGSGTAEAAGGPARGQARATGAAKNKKRVAPARLPARKPAVRPPRARLLEGPLDATSRRLYLTIMLEGSMSLSKSVDLGYSLTEMPKSRVKRISERNFRRTAKWVLANAHQLPLTAATAREINSRLREGMVGEEGDRQPDLASWQFLGDAKAERQLRRDPVGLAERIHTETQGFNEAFFDANGRTARLMADLALIKAGRPPALYPSLAEYARTASPLLFGWSQRERIQQNFPSLVERGEERLNELRAAPASGR